jgi:hypothetical protein
LFHVERSRVPLLVWTKVAASQGKLHTNNARHPGNRIGAGKILVKIKFPEVASTT